VVDGRLLHEAQPAYLSTDTRLLAHNRLGRAPSAISTTLSDIEVVLDCRAEANLMEWQVMLRECGHSIPGHGITPGHSITLNLATESFYTLSRTMADTSSITALHWTYCRSTAERMFQPSSKASVHVS